jgi:hypothetical protein
MRIRRSTDPRYYRPIHLYDDMFDQPRPIRRGK